MASNNHNKPSRIVSHIASEEEANKLSQSDFVNPDQGNQLCETSTGRQSMKTLIKQYMKLIELKSATPEYVLLKSTNYEEYEQRMIEYLPAFYKEYPMLYKKILKGGDMEILELFLDNIEEIDNGRKTINNARNDLGHFLHNKYVKRK